MSDIDKAIQICEEAQIGLGEWEEKQASWENMEKRQVWNEAVIYCAETIEQQLRVAK